LIKFCRNKQFIIFCVIRIVNKDSQIFDLKKYFKQQATLAEQRRKLKKVSETSCNKDHLAPAKKAKLSITRTSEKFQKLTHKNTKNNTLQTIVKASTSSIANNVADNSSGSEYIPSDDEVNSGNILYMCG